MYGALASEARTLYGFTFYMLTALLYLAVTSVSIAIRGRIERRYSLGVRRVEF